MKFFFTKEMKKLVVLIFLKWWWHKRVCEKAYESRYVDISRISSACENHEIPFQALGKNETMFATIDFLVWQILRIIGSQIETNIIFSLIGIQTKWLKCHL